MSRSEIEQILVDLDDDAVADIQVLFRHIEHQSCGRDRLLAHGARRQMHGVAGGHRLAAGKAAEPELDGGGVAADHRNVFRTDADLIGGDLRQHGLQALPHRHGAGEDRDLAGAADADDGRLERAAAGAFQSGGDAEPQEPSLRPRFVAARREPGVIGAVQCEIEAGGKVAAFIDDGAGRARLHRRGVGNGAGRHQIAASHLHTVEAAVARDGVDAPAPSQSSLPDSPRRAPAPSAPCWFRPPTHASL